MTKPGENNPARDTRAARILARSLFRDMRQNGYNSTQILALATELIDLVTQEMKGQGEPDLIVREAERGTSLRSVG